jgi:hypothetical protein
MILTAFPPSLDAAHALITSIWRHDPAPGIPEPRVSHLGEATANDPLILREKRTLPERATQALPLPKPNAMALILERASLARTGETPVIRLALQRYVTQRPSPYPLPEYPSQAQDERGKEAK